MDTSSVDNDTPEEIQFHQYLYVLARIEVWPEARQRWIAESPFGSSRFNAVDASWKQRIASDRILRRAFDNLWPTYVAEYRAKAAAAAPPPREPAVAVAPTRAAPLVLPVEEPPPEPEPAPRVNLARTSLHL